MYNDENSKILDKLNKLYRDGETADKDVWANMRSNVLLVSGDHYAKQTRKYLDHIRGNGIMNDKQKIRLTLNHAQRISKLYVNNIVSAAPDVDIEPTNQKEQQDQKSAELHKAVSEEIKRKHKWQEKKVQWCKDYVDIGEVCVRVGWNWRKGKFKGYTPTIDEETGQAIGQEPVWSGDVVFDRIYGFNIFRPANAQSLEDGDWLGVREMIKKSEIVERYELDEDKKKQLDDESKEAFLIFREQSASYEESKKEVLVKTIYYRPNYDYPAGYFYTFTSGVLLAEGELPMGRWPFVHKGFDEIPTNPRFRAIHFHTRPYQVELNRAASKIAEHQITNGDDKIYLMNGAKLSSGGTAPGIRQYNVTGQPPVISQGRVGEQFFNYIDRIVNEMYQVAMVQEELQDEVKGQVDAYALLFQSARWKKRFKVNIQRFEDFLVEVMELALETTRHYVEQDALIPVIGRHEAVNIAEYKNSNDLRYQIKVVKQSEDPETRLGRQMTLDRFIQYTGSQMSREDIGKFVRLSPYLNDEQILSDFTMDYDNAANMVLALDRGEEPMITEFDDPDYMAGRLVHRMRQSDFTSLQPHVQQLYQLVLQQYQQIKAQQLQQVQAMNADLIPSDGIMVTVDMYVPDPKDATKQKRLRIPQTSLQWLLDRMADQGNELAKLETQQQGYVAQVASHIKGGGKQAKQKPSA